MIFSPLKLDLTMRYIQVNKSIASKARVNASWDIMRSINTSQK